jgi:hypothetical protein
MALILRERRRVRRGGPHDEGNEVVTQVTREKANTAAILCTFKKNAPRENNPDTFWSVSLERPVSGKWLTTNYGQG